LNLSHIKNNKLILGFRVGYKKIILWWMKLQWQVEKGTQIEPLYILGYTSNLGRVKKVVVKWVKSAEKVPRTG
jgi:hypothetical protein